MKRPTVMKRKMTEEELKKVKVERYVEGMFTCDGCRGSVLNATRYLVKNGPAGVFSDSAIDVLSAIAYAFAFAAGELDWVKDLGRDEDNEMP